MICIILYPYQRAFVSCGQGGGVILNETTPISRLKSDQSEDCVVFHSLVKETYS